MRARSTKESSTKRGTERPVKDQRLISQRHQQFCDTTLKLFALKGNHETITCEIPEASGLRIGSLCSYIEKEDFLYLIIIIYQRMFPQSHEGMRTAVAGFDDLALHLYVALETTLNICNELQQTFRLPYQGSHALSHRTLQRLSEVKRLYVSLLEEILHRWNQEGVFHRIFHPSAPGRLQISTEAPPPRQEVHDG